MENREMQRLSVKVKVYTVVLAMLFSSLFLSAAAVMRAKADGEIVTLSVVDDMGQDIVLSAAAALPPCRTPKARPSPI